MHERVTKLVTRKELLTFIALIVGASNESSKGRRLFETDTRKTLAVHIDYLKYMNRTRFQELKALVPFMMEDEAAQSVDEWWKVRGFVDGFNKRRAEELNTSIVYVLDKSMSSMIPRYVPIYLPML